MPNGYINKQVGVSLSGGKGVGGQGFAPGAGSAPKMTERPAFGSPGLPGKAQSNDRSGGVRRAKVRPGDAGL